MDTKRQLLWIRGILIFFVFALVISGLTAIPLRFELGLLDTFLGEGTYVEEVLPSLSSWISLVHRALEAMTQTYPFLAYGYDWLAFGHFAIAIAFLGAINDPVKNRWGIEFGMIACALIIPYALIFGEIRGIPMMWRVIDMLSGIIGILPLYLARKMTLRLEVARAK